MIQYSLRPDPGRCGLSNEIHALLDCRVKPGNDTRSFGKMYHVSESIQALGPRRAKIINKGMIYSPDRGDIDFTVPMFEDYLQRTAT